MDNPEINTMLRYVGKQDPLKVMAKFETGAFTEQCNDIGCTPLMTACSRGNTELVKFFISRNADVNARTIEGRTPLIIAAGHQTHYEKDKKEQAECVKILLDSGADINMESDSGITPLMQACWFGCFESVKLLLEYGANVSIQRNGETALDFAKTFGERFDDFSIYNFLKNTTTELE